MMDLRRGKKRKVKDCMLEVVGAPTKFPKLDGWNLQMCRIVTGLELRMFKGGDSLQIADYVVDWGKIYWLDCADGGLTLFLPGGGDFTPPSTFRQFSPDVLIRGGSNYSLNSSFVITEHIKLVPGQKNFPTARESPPKSAG